MEEAISAEIERLGQMRIAELREQSNLPGSRTEKKFYGGPGMS